MGDIKFDDGERKMGVKESEIEGSPRDDDSRDNDDDNDDKRDRRRRRSPSRSSKKREVGDRVKAKVRGWTKYYSGKITRVNSDDTYDIKFDDGERKMGVKESEVEGSPRDDDSRDNDDRDRDRDK